MIVEEGTKKISADIVDDDDDDSDEDLDTSEDTVVLSVDDDDDDSMADLTSELNIEDLVAKLEATDSDDIARKREIKRRLEEAREERDAMRDLDSTYNFNFDDDP